MMRNILPLSLLVIVCSVGITSLGHSGQLLTDAELDGLGAGGILLGSHAEEEELPLLSDEALDTITAQGFGVTIWPFQYLLGDIPEFRGFLTFPMESEGKIGQTSTGIQFRGSPLLNEGNGLPSRVTK